MEICPGSARKSEVESRGHIPLGHTSIDEWKKIFGQVHAGEPNPISMLIWVVDLPDGSICMGIEAVDGMKACGRQRKWMPTGRGPPGSNLGR